jgi:nicotinamide-nucleotide amidase
MTVLPLSARAAEDARRPSAAQPVDYMVVVTGGELLTGIYADGHTYFLTRTLRPLGLRCVGSMSVDDRRADVLDALKFASRKAALVIVTGGLGPTNNDITRQTLAEFTGIPLAEHPEVIEHMERRFGVPRDRLRANLRRQTQVPTRGGYLRNRNGTAVGLIFETDDTVIAALPGPPRELQSMVRDELVPYLSRRFGTRQPGCSLTLRFAGLGQSQVDQTLKDHVPLPADVTLTSQFENGRVDFTFLLPEDNEQNRARLDELKRGILQHLGQYVYAEDESSLEQRILALLGESAGTLALVEAGSGGSLFTGFGGLEATRRRLTGDFVAPAEDKLRQMLRVPAAQWVSATASEARVRLLAAAASELTGSPWIVAVGELQPADNGAAYVEVVFRSPNGTLECVRTRTGGSDPSARARLATQVLDQLRRRLIAYGKKCPAD